MFLLGSTTFQDLMQLLHIIQASVTVTLMVQDKQQLLWINMQ